MTRRQELPLLLTAFAVLFGLSAIHPFDSKDYVLEVAVPVGGAVILVATAWLLPFTAMCYRMMFLEGVVLLVGAHYTHERVPLFDWIRAPLGFHRNHYDRFAHFAVGFLLCIPFREILVRTTTLRGRSASALAVICVMALAAFYEITEWWIAAGTSPELGAAYLGSQGDPWDAQQDMLADTLGAIVSALALASGHDRAMERMSSLEG